MDPKTAERDTRPEGVALIHGLARSTGSMWLLARRLEREGFETIRIGYPSTRLPLEAAIAYVSEALKRAAPRWRAVHLVGHSLGGVIAREIAERHPELPIGRVVQLGSPNAGSALAEVVARVPAARSFFGPVLEEIPRLNPRRHRTRNVGAIAGRLPLADALVGDALGMGAPNDGFVTVRSAWEGAESRLVIPSVHGWMPLSPAVGREVVRFLKEGRFEQTP